MPPVDTFILSTFLESYDKNSIRYYLLSNNQYQTIGFLLLIPSFSQIFLNTLPMNMQSHTLDLQNALLFPPILLMEHLRLAQENNRYCLQRYLNDSMEESGSKNPKAST